MNTVPEPLLTMPEVCRWLKTDRKTIRRLIRAGALKATKIFTCWRFRRDDVDAFLKSREPRIRKAA